jgi:hypothetical protein
MKMDAGSGVKFDPEILEESALAGAQATIQIAMNQVGLKPYQLAERMERPRSFISKMLGGGHNLTVRTFARALFACGFEPRFELKPIHWGWSIPKNPSETVPASAGTPVLIES